VKHRRHGAFAFLAVVASQIERRANLNLHVAKLAVGFRIIDLGSAIDLHVLLAWTSPADRATIVRFDVHGNATCDVESTSQ